MISVSDIFDTLLVIVNKEKRGTSALSPKQYNQLLPLAVDEVFKFYYGLPEDYQPGRPDPRVAYEKTQMVTDSLLNQRLAPISISIDGDGRADYPSNYIHASSCGYTMLKNQDCDLGPMKKFREVEIVTDAEATAMRADPVSYPTWRYPILVLYKEHMQFYPLENTAVEFTYLKYPEKPNLAYTVNSNDEVVYDPNTSADIDLPPNLRTDLIRQMLGYLGINMSSPDLVQFGELKKQGV
jgi:hypothetical protein